MGVLRDHTRIINYSRMKSKLKWDWQIVAIPYQRLSENFQSYIQTFRKQSLSRMLYSSLVPAISADRSVTWQNYRYHQWLLEASFRKAYWNPPDLWFIDINTTILFLFQVLGYKSFL